MVYQIYSSMVEHLTNFKGVWLDYLLIILAYHIPGFNLAFHTYYLFFLNTNLNYKIVHTCSALVIKSLIGRRNL